jgi:hypothetical protein
VQEEAAMILAEYRGHVGILMVDVWVIENWH